MSIQFNQVPAANRVPFTFVEFDNSGATPGPTVKQYRNLLLGQMVSGGTATPNVPVLVSSYAQARTLFGPGSMLALMFRSYYKAGGTLEVWGMPVVDNAAGVAASGSVTLTGPATAAGTINLYIGGDLVQVAVSLGDTATVIAGNVAAAINANVDLTVTASATAGAVTITAKHKGLTANFMDLRLNYNAPSESLPAGIGATVVAFAGGVADPILTGAISGLGERQYDVIGMPYVNAIPFAAMTQELESRWGAIRQNDGRMVAVANNTLSNLAALGATVNTAQGLIFGVRNMPTKTFELAAAIVAVASASLNNDPAQPLQTLALPGVLAPSISDRFLMSEANVLLFDGIATTYVDDSGMVRIQRAITTYQKSALGANDVSYLDWTTLATLSYLRYDFRTNWMNKYPRAKLADDGTRFGPGQVVVTPKIGKAEAIAKFTQWETDGLVEDFEGFKDGLICIRNATDVNRLDFFLDPNLINALVVTGVKIGFIL